MRICTYQKSGIAIHYNVRIIYSLETYFVQILR